MKVSSGDGYVGLSLAVFLAQHNEVLASNINTAKLDPFIRCKFTVHGAELHGPPV